MAIRSAIETMPNRNSHQSDETKTNVAWPASPSYIGNLHQGHATLAGNFIGACAAMLAFFFTFQAITITGYGSIREKIFDLMIYSIPVGRVGLFLFCLMMIAFTYWAYRMIVAVINSFRLLCEAGQAIEQKIVAIDDSSKLIFEKLLAQLHFSTGSLFKTTRITMLAIAGVWMLFSVLAWVHPKYSSVAPQHSIRQWEQFWSLE